MTDERACATSSRARARTRSASSPRTCSRTRSSTARSRAPSRRASGRPGPGGRDGRAEHPVGGRHRAADAAPALGLAAARGHRGRRRPARPAARGAHAGRRIDERLAAIEGQLAELSAELGSLSSALDARPAPQPREQERLEVDEKPQAGAKPKRSRAPGALPSRGERASAASPSRSSAACSSSSPMRAPVGDAVGDDQQAAGRDAAQPRDREQRRRLHLDRHRARREPAAGALGVGVVEEVGGGDDRRRAGDALERRGQLRVGLRRARRRRARGSSRPRTAPRRPPASEPSAWPASAAAGADADEPPRAEPDQLLDHDRGRSGRPCRCSGSSAARRRPRCPCSPTARGWC